MEKIVQIWAKKKFEIWKNKWKFRKIFEICKIFRFLEIIWKFGQLKIWKKKFLNNLEIWETFGILETLQKFAKFWKFGN